MTRQIRPVPKVWLDCDPGHDDAIALLLALYLPQVDLVGVSSVSVPKSSEEQIKVDRLWG